MEVIWYGHLNSTVNYTEKAGFAFEIFAENFLQKEMNTTSTTILLNFWNSY